MVNTYGILPIKAAVIHGGPRAPGSLTVIAEKLSEKSGVLEPMQSEYTISGLIDELDTQIQSHTQAPITFIGHSWGAWLCVLYAVKHPSLVKNILRSA